MLFFDDFFPIEELKNNIILPYENVSSVAFIPVGKIVLYERAFSFCPAT